MENRVNYLIAGFFVALIFLTIIFVTAILPATTFQPEPSLAAINYDLPEYAAAKRGRDIYRREGCFYCHTQFVRYQDREAGEMVVAGDYVYETPHVLGTQRNGPDLSNEGGKMPDAWHVAHHTNPRDVKPGSIMPPYTHLSDHEMGDLVAYIQTLGSKREAARRAVEPAVHDDGAVAEIGGHGGSGRRDDQPIIWLEPPQELKDDWSRIAKNVPVNDSAIANSGRGIFMQNCAVCHGVTGRGNGPASAAFLKKPANLTRPFYNAYVDAMWYWRVKEGVAGTRMPRWGRTLSEQQMAYVVAFIKTLPRDGNVPSGEIEVTGFDQLDEMTHLSENYAQITHLKELHEESPYIHGGGRP